MAEIIRETVLTKSGNSKTASTSIKNKVSGSETTERMIYYIFGLFEILLAFRLVLKLTGANLNSGFVSFIYGLTSLLALPFDGIFRKGTVAGASAIFEPGTLVAIVVYALIAWGIVKLLQAMSGEVQAE